MDYTDLVMAKSAPQSKSAMDTLIDSFTELVEEARERMSEEQFRQAEKKFDAIVNKVRASRGPRRETA
jgi:outer membrane protein assembly factor BamD (BamD/ComL family)